MESKREITAFKFRVGLTLDGYASVMCVDGGYRKEPEAYGIPKNAVSFRADPVGLHVCMFHAFGICHEAKWKLTTF